MEEEEEQGGGTSSSRGGGSGGDGGARRCRGVSRTESGGGGAGVVLSGQEGIRALAPWLPDRRRPRWWTAALRVAHIIAGFAVLAYIAVMMLLVLLLSVPKFFAQVLLDLGQQHLDTIVEYIYALRVGKVHLAFLQQFRRSKLRRPYHSRYADIFTELPLEGGGVCVVHTVPCLADNFCYVLVNVSDVAQPDSRHPACVVDPCDPTAVELALEILAERHYGETGGLRLEAVLCTHRHWDHAGGNEQLIQLAALAAAKDEAHSVDDQAHVAGDDGGTELEDARERSASADSGAAKSSKPLKYLHPLRVYAGADDDAPGCTHPISHGQCISVGGLRIEAVASPGHTVGSVMFRLANTCPAAHVEALFTGDTLFSGGCGRQWEGDSLDVGHCFATILAHFGGCAAGASEPETQTLLFPGHEYTSRLLGCHIEDLMNSGKSGAEPPGYFLNLCGAYFSAAHRRGLRDKLPTVPCTLASERRINPYFDRSLKHHVRAIMNLVEAQSGQVASADSTVTKEAASDGDSAKALLEQRQDINSKSASSSSHAEHAHLGPSDGGSGLVGSPEEWTPSSTEPSLAQPSCFLTRVGTPSSQFAILYKDDFEALRAELADGRIDGPDAAASLLACEKRALCAPLKTGEGDNFNDIGLCPGELEHVKALEQATGGAEGSDVENYKSEEEEEEESEERRERVRRDAWPSEQQVINALKVLAVHPQVPVGPKAPCPDLELPVSVKRLEMVLLQLGVPETSLIALSNILCGDGVLGQETIRCAPCSSFCGACGPPSTRVDPERREPHVSEESRVVKPEDRDVPGELGELVPLRKVLHSLRPPLVQKMTMQRVRSVCREFRRCIRRCRNISIRCERATPAPQEDKSAKAREAERTQGAIAEHIFSAHKLEDCPLCSKGFLRARTPGKRHADRPFT